MRACTLVGWLAGRVERVGLLRASLCVSVGPAFPWLPAKRLVQGEGGVLLTFTDPARKPDGQEGSSPAAMICQTHNAHLTQHDPKPIHTNTHTHKCFADTHNFFPTNVESIRHFPPFSPSPQIHDVAFVSLRPKTLHLLYSRPMSNILLSEPYSTVSFIRATLCFLRSSFVYVNVLLMIREREGRRAIGREI